MTNLIAREFLSGDVFFPAVVLFLAGCWGVAFTSPGWRRRSFRILLVAGGVLFCLSGLPLRFNLLLLLLFGWQLGESCRNKQSRVTPWVLCVIASLCGGLVVAMEAPYHINPRITVDRDTALYVVGDSLTLGAEPQGENWPEQFGKRLNVPVSVISFPGAKTDTILPKIPDMGENKSLVLVELGGNDLLDGVSAKTFRKNLEELLKQLQGKNRRIAMIELPLVPLYHTGYGAVQRDLAKQYGVVLIPKHLLADVLMTPGATGDGLHFAETGHALLAERLAALFRVE